MSLAAANSLRLPARVAYFCTPRTNAEALGAFAEARRSQGDIQILGAGSNVVLAPRFAGAIIRPADRSLRWEVRRGRVRVTAGAGVVWHDLVLASVKRRLWGLENLALIPGSVGAAPVQNIGAYGCELAECFVELTALDLDSGRVERFDRAACGFGYRDSIFRRGDRPRWLITHVTLELDPAGSPRLDYPGIRDGLGCANQATPLAVAATVTGLRRRKLPDPWSEPNAGSFFKNPVVSQRHAKSLRAHWPAMPSFADGADRAKLSAAWLIEQCGWKGQRRGPVGVSAQHALVLVHYGGGTAGNILALADAVRADVAHQCGVGLEIEPRILGRVPDRP